MTQAAALQKPLREYETVYVLRPTTTTDAAKALASRIEDILAKEAGTLRQVETWGSRLLSYPIKRHHRGIFIYLKYLGRGGLVAELERNLRLADPVIRYQTVKLRDEVDPGGIEPSEPSSTVFDDIVPDEAADESASLAERLGMVESLSSKSDRGFGSTGTTEDGVHSAADFTSRDRAATDEQSSSAADSSASATKQEG